MFNTKWLSKKEIENLILEPLTEDEILACRKKHSLVPFLDEIVKGTTEPGTGGTAYFHFLNREEPILDCTSQAWSLNLGHAPADVNYAVAVQSQYSNHVRYGYLTPIRVKLVNKLASIAPGQLKDGRVALNNLGGGGAVEAAIRLAYVNSRSGDQIVTFFRGYHGSSLALTGATQQLGLAIRYRPFGIDRWLKTFFPYCYRCPWGYKGGLGGKKDPDCKLECLEFVKQHIEQYHISGVAAVLIEPNQGAGGQIPAPVEFLIGLKKICKKNKIVLIYDECQTGFGRSGKMWISEYYSDLANEDVSPDILAATKGAAGGFPLGITLAKPKLKMLSEAEEHSTYSSNPALMAASLITIEILEKNKIPENAAKQGAKISKFLNELKEKYPQIGDVRGPGLFIGVEFVKDPESREPNNELVAKFLSSALKNNILFGKSMPILKKSGEMMRNIVKIKPPLIISDEDTEEICFRFEKSLKDALEK
ncbi:MAG: aminotransferase class III-fold pyridoxal phosphate-dependent enzyme [Candidatus Lokiarchaeota archaeon]|nr:aminotransferase class III-fold pyridoxal phosphate-dependent enzyme [Candidatus Harpocratesius repetitus]